MSTTRVLEVLKAPDSLTKHDTHNAQYQLFLHENYSEIISHYMQENYTNFESTAAFIKNNPKIKEKHPVGIRTDEEQKIDNDCYLVRKRSADAWEESFFEIIQTTAINAQKSFHEVEKIIRKKKLGFYKHNAINSPMSELETFASQLYRLFVPPDMLLVPKMHTVYNDKLNITGCISKAIPGFKSLREAPLEEKDFVIEALDNHQLTVLDFIQIYKQYKNQKNYKLSEIKDDQLLTFELNKKIISIKASDLKNFELIKGNGITLTLSYFFEEDDLHCGNISKKGERIDFDMSLWPILSKFKNTGIYRLLDRALRTPTPNQFDISVRDIQNFPVLTDALPYYWPIYSEEGYLRMITRILSRTSSNAYCDSDMKMYDKFARHPVFMYYKFETLLKICLMDPNVYHAIGEVEINNEVPVTFNKYKEMPANYVAAEHLKERTKRLEETLYNVPEFRQFYQAYGKDIVKDFLAQLDMRNQQIQTKVEKRRAMDPDFDKIYPEYIKQKIELENIKKRAESIEEKCNALVRKGSRQTDRLRKLVSTF